MTPLPVLGIAGLDEAGRGAWAGPVVAAAVVLRSAPPLGLTDSKQLTRRQRERLFEQLTAEHDWAVGVASAEEVDRHNVLQAAFLAMRRAFAELHGPASGIVVDGNADPQLPTCLPVELMAKADVHVAAVSAASVIAKVTRDRLMQRLALAHPGYGFERHAGYGVPAHAAALARLGPCAEHRMSFSPLAAYARRGGCLPNDCRL